MSFIGGVKKVVGVVGTVGTAIKTAKTTWDYGTMFFKLLFADLDGNGKSELEDIWNDLIKLEKKATKIIADRIADMRRDFLDLKDDLDPIADRILKLKAHMQNISPPKEEAQ